MRGLVFVHGWFRARAFGWLWAGAKNSKLSFSERELLEVTERLFLVTGLGGASRKSSFYYGEFDPGSG